MGLGGQDGVPLTSYTAHEQRPFIGCQGKGGIRSQGVDGLTAGWVDVCGIGRSVIGDNADITSRSGRQYHGIISGANGCNAAGTSALTGAVTTTGAATVGTNLTVNGTSTLTGAVAASAALTVGTTLGVTGISTFTGGMRQSVENAITAHAGGGQGSAYALTKTLREA